MKLKLWPLLCAALLPAALLAQNVDVGIAWADSLPDTLRPGQTFPARVRATNYTPTPAGGYVWLYLAEPNGTKVYTYSQGVYVDGISSTIVTFPPIGLLTLEDFIVGCTLVVRNDTTPANDTISHYVHVGGAGVDVGVAWDPPLPETIPPDTTVQPSVRVTVHAAAGPINVDVFFTVCDTNGNVRYRDVVALTGLTQGAESLVTFLTLNPAGCWLACSMFTARDTYPANDAVWWRPVIRNAVEEPGQPALLATGLRPIPTHFSRSVVIPCREPAPVYVYDACGKLVRTLEPGRDVVWDGRDQLGAELPCGVYLVVTPSPSSSPPQEERAGVRRRESPRICKVVLTR